MRAQNAGFVGHLCGDPGYRLHRRVAGQNAVFAGVFLHLDKDILLDFEVLGHVFENDIRAAQALFQRVVHADILGRALVDSEHLEVGPRLIVYLGQYLFAPRVQRHRMALRGEHLGDALPHHSRAYYRNSFPSLFLVPFAN